MDHLKIEYLPIDDLKPYDRNAKEHPQKQIDQIIESIKQFGMNDPIGIWGDQNLIVEGHGRLLALKQMGATEAPTIRLDHMNDEQRRAYTLAHNKITMNSGFNLEILNEELDSLGIDMTDFGFSLEDMEQDEFEPINDEELPETQNFDYILKFGNKQVIMTEDEYRDLLQRYTDYAEENGVTFGFVRSLLND